MTNDKWQQYKRIEKERKERLERTTTRTFARKISQIKTKKKKNLWKFYNLIIIIKEIAPFFFSILVNLMTQKRNKLIKEICEFLIDIEIFFFHFQGQGHNDSSCLAQFLAIFFLLIHSFFLFLSSSTERYFLSMTPINLLPSLKNLSLCFYVFFYLCNYVS